MTNGTEFHRFSMPDWSADQFSIEKYDGTTTVSGVGGTPVASTVQVIMASSPGTTISLWVNDTQILNGAGFNNGTVTISNGAVGYNRTDTDSYTDGHICEVLLYSAELSAEQLRKLRNYFIQTYGI